MEPPDIPLLLAGWWGGTWEDWSSFAGVSIASNVIVGDNPLYQLEDFLAFYPKFGRSPQNLVSFTIAEPGQGYTADDLLSVVQEGAQKAVIKVTTVDGVGGITGASVQVSGVGYRVAEGVLVTGGTGDGASIDITEISQFVSAGVPEAVLKMYVNLASACLSYARWKEQWPFAMALFIAHYATLYLRSEGGAGGTAQQIASSGMAIGLKVGESAGDVSKTMQYFNLGGWESWGSWSLSVYGQELITMANAVGMGIMYIF